MKVKKNNFKISRLFILIGIVLTVTFSLIFLGNTFTEKTTSSIWNGSVATSFNSGTGTSDDPYVIKDGSELAYLFTVINGESSGDYFNKYYVLNNNIDLNNYDFSYLNLDKTFSGNIDGMGYTISNFTLNNCNTYNDVCYYGLFGNLDSATIANINLKSISISNKNTSDEIISLIGNSVDSSINNLSISDIEYNITNDETYSVLSSGILFNDLGNNNISNINIDIESNDNTSVVVSNYLDSNISDILYKSNDLGLGILIDSAYEYRYENNLIVFTDHYPVNTILETLNRNSSYDWVYENNNFRIKNNGVNEPVNRPRLMMMMSPGTGNINAHESGVVGTIIYINDFEMDTDYYQGRNYTNSTNNAYPTLLAGTDYTESNLVRVQATYYGKDYSLAHGGSGYGGTVSPTENVDTFVYYKVYPVNTNGTNSTSDDYVEFELIDHPFAKRPNGMGFNGWVTDNNNAEITLDTSLYVRSVKIPVTYTGNKPTDIVIDFYATWVPAKTYTITESNTSWSTIQSGLDATGLVQLATSISVSGLYERGTVARYSYYPNPSYRLRNGSTTQYQRVQNNTTSCNTNGGCTYYRATTDTTYNPNKTYYTIDTSSGADRATFTEYTPPSIINLGDSTAGLFRSVRIPYRNSLVGYYNSSGVMQTSGTCNTSAGCTQYYEKIGLFDSNNNLEVAVSGTAYYKYVTRDTNIVYLYYGGNFNQTLGSTTQTKPFTFTSYNNGTDRRNSGYWTASSTYCNNDLRIEWMRINGNTSRQTGTANPSTTYALFGKFKNLKIGRGIIRQTDGNVTFGSLISSANGGTGSSSSRTKYKIIVESGFFNNMAAVGTTGTYYVDGTVVYGSDYDRITGNNSGLDVRFVAGSIWGGTLHSNSSDTAVAINVIVKSGTFGSNRTDYTTGMYVGGRSSGTIYAPCSLTIEGGSIYNISGGPLVDDDITDTNIVYVYMKGGTIDAIFGGAGTTLTYGNRIIQLTGGTVNYAVCGGSNGVEADEGDGTLSGSTYIYAGGHVIVGNQTYVTNNTKETNSNIEAGSIFGAGNGNSDSESIGSVFNSRIVIDDGATIRRNVYGGGNYGATGSMNNNSRPSSTTEININGGTVVGSIYGAGNNNGSGNYSHTVRVGSGWNYTNVTFYNVTSTVTITQNGGTVGKIYGGSNVSGTVYGSTHINIYDGTVSEVYGGGEGSETYVRDNVDITIGKPNVSGKPTVNTAVYGGSAFGTVNATTKNAAADSTKHVNVTVENGNITGSVFGGAKGNSSNTPYVNGNIAVNINDGTVNNVFGGFDEAGSPKGTVNVYLSGGTVGSAYGGGNKTSVTTTNVYLQGSSCTNVYGGSNQSGNVTTSNVTITSGSSTNVYGGNNAGGTVTTSYVTMSGGTVNDLYGGNNAGGTNGTSNVTITGGSITGSAYGGGNNASTTTPHIRVDAGTISNVFGGGNNATSGTTDVKIYGGNITNTYGGGNNAAVTTSNVNLYGGTLGSVYGGGNQAGATTTNVTSVSGYSPTGTNLYGGSNQSGDIANTYVNVNSGAYTNVYGGNNAGGVSSTTHVTITNGTTANVYGGGDNAVVGATNVNVTGGTVNDLYGGGNNAQVNTNTNVNITGGTITHNAYGGGNNGVTAGNTYVKIENGTINGSAYGGGNGASAIVNGNTNIEVGGTTEVGTSSCVCPANNPSCATLNTCSVFGGGNAAATGTTGTNNSTSNVNIVGGTIHGNIYGGANTSVIYGAATVNIGDAATVSNSITKDDILVNGTVFGGGEANASGSEIFDYYFISVTKAIEINIDAGSYTSNTLDVQGSIFGSGNASSSGGTSEINIYNYGTSNNPQKNISVQRTDTLTIDNSALLLSGATDRTNEYSNILFDLSRIDVLNLQNNSTLYLRNGANVLGEFNSLDSNGDYAEVDIDSDLGTVTKTVDNRVYMFEGEVLNIGNERLTAFNDVNGMTFFGMFKNSGTNGITTGIYGDYAYGANLTGAGMFLKGSYVMGAHKLNHDITVDGFYSNFEEEGLNVIKYIEPTPDDAAFYKWIIGELVQEYKVDLVASKYSTLGAIEVPFDDFTAPNTTFTITDVDFSGLEGVRLINKNDIPKRAATTNDADTIMGLSMEPSNTGWLTSGSTSFYSYPTPQISGVRKYEGDNTTNVPSLLFYLYHSKNLGSTGDMGNVIVEIEVMTRIHDLKSEPATIVLNIDLSRVLYTTNDYEAALTPGRKYELFASTATNITAHSSISAYYSLYADETNLYQHNNYRVLTSTIVFPENTKITMIDLSDSNNIKYYYHVMTASDVTTANANYSGEVSYNLSMFELMGSFNSNVYYSDTTANSGYYHSTDDYSQEEFIFIIDFEDVTFPSSSFTNDVISDCIILIELIDPTDPSKTISVMGNEVSFMTYNIYNNNDAVIDISGTITTDTIYNGDTIGIDLDTVYTQASVNGVTVYDTKAFDEKVGIKISLINSDNEVVAITSMMGLTYEIDGVDYSPTVDGIARIKISDRVGSINTWVNMKTGTSNIPTGTYTLRIDSFGSPDGIYYGLNTSDYVEFEIDVVNERYGLDIETTPNEMVLDKTTGYTLNGDNTVTYNIEYNSNITNPSIRIMLLRRRYNTVDDTVFLPVDLADYVSNTLGSPYNTNEYLIVSNPNVETTLELHFNDDLLPGTYRIDFMLYGGNSKIGTVERYIIIK